MSDDKREKLREYLRNNRPKNRVNLCNNSNNKENSNKSLENDSNLDNSQISNNKTNLIKRDYDKKPLVLKDYTISIRIHSFLNMLLFFVLIYYYASCLEDGYEKFIILKIMLVCAIFFLIDLFFILIFSNAFVMLHNSMALFYKNNELKEKYSFSKTEKLEFNSFLYTMKMYNFLYLPILFVLMILGFLDGEIKVVLFAITAPFVLVFPFVYDVLIRMIVYKKSNGDIKNFFKYYNKFYLDVGWNRSYRNIIHKGFSIFFFNEKDYKDLKEYIQIVFDKNLDKDIKSVSE